MVQVSFLLHDTYSTDGPFCEGVTYLGLKICRVMEDLSRAAALTNMVGVWPSVRLLHELFVLRFADTIAIHKQLCSINTGHCIADLFFAAMLLVIDRYTCTSVFSMVAITSITSAVT